MPDEIEDGGDENLAAPESPARPSARLDSWANPDTGMGMPGVDNRLGWTPFSRPRNQRRQRELWLGDGLAGRIVELPASEMTRARGQVKLGERLGQAERLLHARLEELKVWALYALALKYDRAYGGGALVLALDDGMPWSEPVDTKRLRSVQALHPATPDELTAERYWSDPRSKDYGTPRLYRWRPYYLPGYEASDVSEKLVHSSRVIAFRGIQVDMGMMMANGGWGNSLLDRCEEPIRDAATALAGVSTALNNFNQEVLGLKELGRVLGDKHGKERLNERVADMRLYRSMLGLLLIDKDETYERKPVTMSGVADSLKTLFQRLSAVSSIPVPILFGYQEVGLGDTGKSTIDTWHAWVDAERNNRLRPELEQLISLILLSTEGPTKGQEPEDWTLEFGPLAERTQEQVDAQRKLQADIDQIYLTNQVLAPADVARSRFSGPSGFSTRTEPDLSAFEALQPPGPVEPEPAVPEARGDAAGTEGGLAPAPEEPLNGAQMAQALDILGRVARKELPRESGVAALTGLVRLQPQMAESIMGPVGRTFFSSPTGAEPATPPTRADSAQEYAALLVAELEMGHLSEAEVVRKVARLYRIEPRQARAIVARLRGAREDALGRTNFPRQGNNRRVALASSSWQVFSPAYAQDLRENWPEVWTLGGNGLGDTQFSRLLPLARGAAVDTPLEEHAVRLREAWAERHERNRRPAGVVALVKWLVVGRIGEERMREVLEGEKDKVRRRRAQGG